MCALCGGAQALDSWAHRLGSCDSWALERRLGGCGPRVQLPCGVWSLPGPEIEPMSPALAGGFLPLVQPGKSSPSLSLKTVSVLTFTTSDINTAKTPASLCLLFVC